MGRSVELFQDFGLRGARLRAEGGGMRAFDALAAGCEAAAEFLH